MWLDQQVSLYDTYSDNTGRPTSYRDILYAESPRDKSIINSLRGLDRTHPDYKVSKVNLKGKLRCYTPAALLKSKAKNQVTVIARTGVMQLDFDHGDIHEYDVEELKRAVFSLPFIAFCGLSCSGDGFYALGLIAEPEKLNQYAEHCFDVLLEYGIKADTSKGKKVENLRYVSYDANMLIRENPTPLYVKHFKKKKQEKLSTTVFADFKSSADLSNERVAEGIKTLSSAQVGHRWPTVQKVAYAFGGMGNTKLLDDIKHIINHSTAFQGEEDKYCKCAEDCFAEGLLNPYKEKDPTPSASAIINNTIPKEIEFIPSDMPKRTLRNYERNNCYLFLKRLFTETVADKLVFEYCVGSSKRQPGAHVYWLTDSLDRVREAKVMLLDPDLESEPAVHTAFAGRDIINNSKANLRRCFFGEHLLTKNPEKKVAIAVNEIDAMVASVYYPEYVWLATGGDRGCNWSDKDVCQILSGRRVILFPPASSFEKWRIKAAEIKERVNCTISVSSLLKSTDKENTQTSNSLKSYLLGNRDSSGLALTSESYPLFWDR
jgi:hypothetical protein